MSRVFVAEELALGRQVVIKVLPPEYAAMLSADRFRREIQLASRLQHPHIVPVADGGRSQRHALLHHALRRGGIAPRPAQPEAANRHGGCRQNAGRSRRRAGLRAPAWCGAPRHQTGKHPAQRPARGGHGFRDREGAGKCFRQAGRSPRQGFLWELRPIWRRNRSPPIPTSTIAQTSMPSARWATRC